MADLKQVIILRKDLNMRKGKMIAQGAHASMAALTQRMKVEYEYQDGKRRLYIDVDDNEYTWIKEHFAKIALGVDSDKALLEVYEQAVAAGLPCVLITDEGLTEFHGVHTNTAVAIGPAKRDLVDKITGELSLL